MKGSSFCGWCIIIWVFGVAVPSVWPLCAESGANCWYREREGESGGGQV